MKYKYILFDLDGTLIDTNKLIIDSFKHTYKKHLGRDVEEGEILKHFGEPLRTTLERYAKDNVDELYNTYIEFNESTHDSTVTLCCNIKECLEALKEMGCVLGVVTAKRAPIAHRGLELFDIKKHFSTVVTLQDTTNYKPHPEPILKAMELLNAKPEETLMVGDSIFDMKCAHNAGVKAVLVSWGAATHHIIDEEPDYQVDDAMQIAEIARG